jgi:hypothetical protein
MPNPRRDLIRSKFDGRVARLVLAIAVDRNESGLLEAEGNRRAALVELDVRRNLRDRQRKMKQTTRSIASSSP